MTRKLLFVLALVGIMLIGAASVSAQEVEGYVPGSCTQYYTVQRGDYLARIAARFGTTVHQLIALNTFMNPNLIYAGQVICIRGTVYPPPPPPPPPRTYTVQYGDRLYRIGLRFGVPWPVIASANGIYNPNLIYPGQVLVIPNYW